MSQRVILEYGTHRAIYNVPNTYPELNLQKNWLSYRLEAPELKTDDTTNVVFRPNGIEGEINGETLPIWEGREK